MKVYISLPIHGTDENKARKKAKRLAEVLKDRGYEPVNPFKIYAGQNPTYDDYLAADLRALMDCDAIYLCIGWENSCGCNVEHGLVRAYKEHQRKPFRVLYESLETPNTRNYING